MMDICSHDDEKQVFFQIIAGSRSDTKIDNTAGLVNFSNGCCTIFPSDKPMSERLIGNEGQKPCRPHENI